MDKLQIEEDKAILRSTIRNCLILIGILCYFCCLAGCTPSKHVYKVTFGNGDVEYYELDYKPKKDAKSIKCEGETILGIDKIERFD